MSKTPQPSRRRPDLVAVHVVDVFVYVVVLNLADQYAPAVITESFSTSLLVAVLLKLVLEAVLAVKSAAKKRLKGAPRLVGKVLAGATLVVILPGSKLLVLELVGFFFGGSVHLGGFFLVTGLIFVLVFARAGVRLLLGVPDGS